jgi:hypothetical protein
MIQKAATWFGIGFILIAILGFLPGVVTQDGMLLGIFQVDTIHNIIHLLSGVVALVCAGSLSGARMYFKVFGVIYALIALIGFIQGQTVLSIMGTNMADNILNALIAVASLLFGFGMKSSETMSTPSM